MFRFNRFCIKVFILIFFISFAACTSKSSTPVSVTRAGSEEQSSQPSSNEIDAYAWPAPLDNNSNLFDTSIANDVQPINNTAIPITSQQQACLNGQMWNGGSATTPQYGNSNTTGLSSACVDPSFTGQYGQDSLFDLGLESFGSMDSCYQMVMSRGPQMCATGMDANTVFQMSSMALVRCFRNLLNQQMAAIQWAPQQQQVYQNNDNNLFLLLSLFSQNQ